MSEKDIAEVYEDRNLLALAFATLADEAGYEVGTYEHDEWAVVYVVIPTYGQVSWHMRPETVPAWLPERDAETVFDGHDRETKNNRLANFAFMGAGNGDDALARGDG